MQQARLKTFIVACLQAHEVLHIPFGQEVKVIGLHETNLTLYVPFLTAEGKAATDTGLRASIMKMNTKALLADDRKHIKRSEDQWERYFGS